jgi:hypothetical protein
MGLFDEIRCEYPLPDKEVQEQVFQTKSLDNALDQYIITGDGRLILHQVRYESVPEEERPYYGTPEWESNPILQSCGCMSTVPVGDVEVPHHGDIIFYTSIGPNHQWFEYRARFTEGRVQWVKRESEGYR